LTNIDARCVGIMHGHWLTLIQCVWCLCTCIS